MLPGGSANFTPPSAWALDVRYEHERTGRALRDHGASAPNPSQEVVDFDTAFLTLRHGLGEHVHLAVTVPVLSIASDKVQGEPYLRHTRGVGDVLAIAGLRLVRSPEIVFEAGVRLPTGDNDRTDALGNRVNDILALGSGTTDPVFGLSVYETSAGVHGLDLFGSVRLRVSGGTNSWGYHFGNEAQFGAGVTYSWRDRLRLTPVLSGFHIGKDEWLGNTVPERGATFLHFAPEIAWHFQPDLAVGVSYRVPVWMRLEGAQMVAESTLGLVASMDLGRVAAWLHGITSSRSEERGLGIGGTE